MQVDPRPLDVIAPNLKRRYSGVTSTVIRLVPLQARDIAIATTGPRLPAEVPQFPLSRLLTLPRSGPHGPRIWHARRNTEMLAGLALKYLLGKRLRLLFTSAAQRRHSRYTRWLIARQDAVIATSARSASFLDRPATVIRHGIDIAAFTPPEDRRSLRLGLGLDPDATLVGAFGRLRPSKGTDLLVAALIDLLPARPGVQAILMGGVTAQFETFVADLKSRVAAAGLADRIRFLPEDTGWTIAPWFQAIDLYAAPARNEGFGLTPLEAMACGVPVIASDAGAFAELVAEGETGRIVPAGDGPAFAAALAEALDAPATRARWAAAARPHVAARFRIEDEAAAINALYRRLLTGA